MTVHRLISIDMVNTPGIIFWARSGMNKTQMSKFFRSAFPSLPSGAILNLIGGEYTLEDANDPNGGTIVVED